MPTGRLSLSLQHGRPQLPPLWLSPPRWLPALCVPPSLSHLISPPLAPAAQPCQGTPVLLPQQQPLSLFPEPPWGAQDLPKAAGGFGEEQRVRWRWQDTTEHLHERCWASVPHLSPSPLWSLPAHVGVSADHCREARHRSVPSPRRSNPSGHPKSQVELYRKSPKGWLQVMSAPWASSVGHCTAGRHTANPSLGLSNKGGGLLGPQPAAGRG